jgi:hypothetical protein
VAIRKAGESLDRSAEDPMPRSPRLPVNIAEIRRLQGDIVEQLLHALAEDHGAKPGADGTNALAAFHIIAGRLLQGELPLMSQSPAAARLVDAWVELERFARSLER